MSVSRRLRFEILRRDNYTCRYCGAAAPDGPLTVDHVVPVALGGGDEPSNLVTSCGPCNSGKSSIQPDSSLVEDVDAAALLFAKAIERAAAIRRKRLAWTDEVFEWFEGRWGEINSGYLPWVPNGGHYRPSLEKFLSLGLNPEDIDRYVGVTDRKNLFYMDRWSYFCGCCWRELSTRQEMARQMIEDGKV